MDTAERLRHITQKREIILGIIGQKFQDSLDVYLSDANYESIDELDAWLDDRLKEYYAVVDKINEFYDNMLNS